MSGRKRHILVDTEGNLVVIIVHPANIADRDGADWVLEAAKEKSTRLRHIWAINSLFEPRLMARNVRGESGTNGRSDPQAQQTDDRG